MVLVLAQLDDTINGDGDDDNDGEAANNEVALRLRAPEIVVVAGDDARGGHLLDECDHEAAVVGRGAGAVGDLKEIIFTVLAAARDAVAVNIKVKDSRAAAGGVDRNGEDDGALGDAQDLGEEGAEEGREGGVPQGELEVIVAVLRVRVAGGGEGAAALGAGVGRDRGAGRGGGDLHGAGGEVVDARHVDPRGAEALVAHLVAAVLDDSEGPLGDDGVGAVAVGRAEVSGEGDTAGGVRVARSGLLDKLRHVLVGARIEVVAVEAEGDRGVRVDLALVAGALGDLKVHRVAAKDGEEGNLVALIARVDGGADLVVVRVGVGAGPDAVLVGAALEGSEILGELLGVGDGLEVGRGGRCSACVLDGDEEEERIGVVVVAVLDDEVRRGALIGGAGVEVNNRGKVIVLGPRDERVGEDGAGGHETVGIGVLVLKDQLELSVDGSGDGEAVDGAADNVLDVKSVNIRNIVGEGAAGADVKVEGEHRLVSNLADAAGAHRLNLERQALDEECLRLAIRLEQRLLLRAGRLHRKLIAGAAGIELIRAADGGDGRCEKKEKGKRPHFGKKYLF